MKDCTCPINIKRKNLSHQSTSITHLHGCPCLPPKEQDMNNIEQILEAGRLSGIEQAKAKGGWTIGQLLTALEAIPSSNGLYDSSVVGASIMGASHGLEKPHSYRGYYDRLSLNPTAADSIPVNELRVLLRGSIGETFEGYKGGLYKMTADTLLHIAAWGDCGVMVYGLSRSAEYPDHYLIETMEETY